MSGIYEAVERCLEGSARSVVLGRIKTWASKIMRKKEVALGRRFCDHCWKHCRSTDAVAIYLLQLRMPLHENGGKCQLLCIANLSEGTGRTWQHFLSQESLLF